MPMRVGEEGINTDMLDKFMFHRIIGNLRCGAPQEILKSASNHRSHIISAMVVASARSFASVLERDTVASFLDFH